MSVTLRPATPADRDDVLRLIHALAAYERAPEAVTATPADLDATLFSPDPRVFCHVAEVDGRVVGMAVWFLNYSTWHGRHGIYLEDLFVEEAHRGRGLGRALLRTLAGLCVARGYTRLQWWVLDWNEPAIGFYRRLGAAPMDEWTVFRVEGEALAALAAGA